MQGYLLNRENGLLIVGGEQSSRSSPFPKTFKEAKEIFDDVGIRQMFKYTGENWIGKRITY